MTPPFPKRADPLPPDRDPTQAARTNIDQPDARQIVERFHEALGKRSAWETHWQECYDYALPRHDGALKRQTGGEHKHDHLFDGTAPDAVEQLSASILGLLTPPWGRWFGLNKGSDFADNSHPDDDLNHTVDGILEKSAKSLQSSFARSNFAVEMHQCYLDLVTIGTACLMFEEAGPGEVSAFRFTAIPIANAILEEGPRGRLDQTFRRALLSRAQLFERFPKAALPEPFPAGHGEKDFLGDERFSIIEAVLPETNGRGYSYVAVMEGRADHIDHQDGGGASTGSVSGEPVVLKTGHFQNSPFINFRWLKAPGEVYGRSPVMKALPDIKTVNKAVELTLKNASIAVTGIWQADDDGVLNPATVKLTPGTIIPKAVGSAGLKPLDAPGRFDISQQVLEDLRGNIRRAMLTDQLGQIAGPRMTATEVLERSAEMARLLGATFGRLQAELLTPLVTRAVEILARRGEIPAMAIDGHLVEIEYLSPLARDQANKEAKGLLDWAAALAALGPEGLALIDAPKAAEFLARAYSVPRDVIKAPDDKGLAPLINALSSGGADIGALVDSLGADSLGQLLQSLPPDVVEKGKMMLQAIMEAAPGSAGPENQSGPIANQLDQGGLGHEQ